MVFSSELSIKHAMYCLEAILFYFEVKYLEILANYNIPISLNDFIHSRGISIATLLPHNSYLLFLLMQLEARNSIVEIHAIHFCKGNQIIILIMSTKVLK